MEWDGMRWVLGYNRTYAWIHSRTHGHTVSGIHSRTDKPENIPPPLYQSVTEA